jgi:hypothetical protein
MPKRIDVNGRQFEYDDTLTLEAVVGMYTRAHVDLALYYSTPYEGLEGLAAQELPAALRLEITIKALIRFQLDMENDTVAQYPQTNVPET